LVTRDEVHALHRLHSAFGIKVVGGELLGAKAVKPMTLAMRGAARFISLGDQAFQEGIMHRLDGDGGFLRSSFDEVGKGALTECFAVSAGKKVGIRMRGPKGTGIGRF